MSKIWKKYLYYVINKIVLHYYLMQYSLLFFSCTYRGILITKDAVINGARYLKKTIFFSTFKNRTYYGGYK